MNLHVVVRWTNDRNAYHFGWRGSFRPIQLHAVIDALLEELNNPELIDVELLYGKMREEEKR